MTRTVPANLLAHIQEEVTTIATCWKITRRDAQVFAFTDHDADIVFGAVTYLAATGFSPSEIALKDDASVSNLEVEGILDSATITEEDLIAGLFDYAAIEIFLVNYDDSPENGGIPVGLLLALSYPTFEAITDRIILHKGYLGEVSISKGKFHAEIRGLTQHLSQKVGDVYSPTCRAILGDTKCTKDLTAFTFVDAIDEVTSNQIFYAGSLNQATGYFNGGEIEWTSGNNDGLKMEIKEFMEGTVTLCLAMPFTLQVADAFIIKAGCDKQFSTCKDKFNNIANFRGEPHIPGQDKILETASTFSNSNE